MHEDHLSLFSAYPVLDGIHECKQLRLMQSLLRDEMNNDGKVKLMKHFMRADRYVLPPQ